ncbi:HD domain-containing protein [Clostridium sp. YIM B02505]|uniref:HD domain-containing protein n=1 Tax=Clostridium yunnanense TaxID=2800325 RepID=A0ABS1EP55_9CLOT|nr:HD domain-containing protein [Clostridium yunnanense]MBK1811140.1 HD domain-containing protein [Clostridium yunnanense]
MNINLIEEAKNYLETFMKDKVVEYEVTHPWRRNSRYIVLHCYRVCSIAMEIVNNYENELSTEDIELIQVAAILHDLGKVYSRGGHAEKSGEIVEKWLELNPSVAKLIEDKKRLINIIKDHSNKGVKDDDLVSSILKDADLLDELGAMSIFMVSNRLDRQTPYFFEELYKMLKEDEVTYCYEELKKLQTPAAKEILLKKIKFINSFVTELEYELKGSSGLTANK